MQRLAGVDGVIALQAMQAANVDAARALRNNRQRRGLRVRWPLLVCTLAACSADDGGAELEGGPSLSSDMTAGLGPDGTGAAPATLPMSAPPPPVRMPGDTTGVGGSAETSEQSSAQPSAVDGATTSDEPLPDDATTAEVTDTAMTNGSDEQPTTDVPDRTRPGWDGQSRGDDTGEVSTGGALSSDDSSPSDTSTDAVLTSDDDPGASPLPGEAGTETGRIAGMTAAHNAVREAVALQSLAPLTWSEELAEYAQEWADELAKDCVPRHRSNLSYGENIATFGSTAGGGPQTTAAEAVEGWAAEIDCWQYGEFMRSDSCDTQCVAQLNASGCGHYTQLVWSRTERVGCGLSQCSRNQGGRTFQFDVWVCNYDPPGNFIGQTPY